MSGCARLGGLAQVAKNSAARHRRQIRRFGVGDEISARRPPREANPRIIHDLGSCLSAKRADLVARTALKSFSCLADSELWRRYRARSFGARRANQPSSAAPNGAHGARKERAPIARRRRAQTRLWRALRVDHLSTRK